MEVPPEFACRRLYGLHAILQVVASALVLAVLYDRLARVFPESVATLATLGAVVAIQRPMYDTLKHMRNCEARDLYRNLWSTTLLDDPAERAMVVAQMTRAEMSRRRMMRAMTKGGGTRLSMGGLSVSL
jgi:hypothetical protein